MSLGRLFAAGVASLAVAGGTVVALGMSAAAKDEPPASRPSTAVGAAVSRPAFLPMHAAAPGAASVATTPAPRSGSTSPVLTVPRPAPSLRPTTTNSASTSTSAPTPSRTSAAPRALGARHAVAAPRPAAATTSAAPRGQALPLPFRTGTATRVITVTASSTANTTATLQAWAKVAGGGWRTSGSAVTAHVGADGLSSHPSEYRSATPIGSFTLTQAFGHDANPGTRLPYIHTRPSDWWISQSGPLYNTHQRCASNCAFTRGSPNEHLYYETPYYNYAVVIDYNTRNAPGGVRQGAGSAFFLHVTDGRSTAGCVAIGQAKLVSLMRWLRPATHPRILIGVR
jgi:L,D-peptidoglycan transpeptidase YkuD (ErfK/YbiS/YcfS/YnhG family)